MFLGVNLLSREGYSQAGDRMRVYGSFLGFLFIYDPTVTTGRKKPTILKMSLEAVMDDGGGS